MRTRKSRIFVCDFETTVYEGQESTEVWASACVEVLTEDVKIFHSIDEQFNYFVSLESNIIAYYHNLKFDGSFWLSYFLRYKGFKQAINYDEKDYNKNRFQSQKEMKNNTFSYVISDTGQWYSIKIKIHGKIIEFRDSLKLLPFSVERIGKSFHTKHQKLTMEYNGFRYAGCEITEQEKEYISNDVLVIKEALEMMFEKGNNKLTIGSCCLAQFKQSIGRKTYDKLFPDLSTHEIDKNLYGSYNADEYIRLSYHGGWCYLVEGKEKKIHKDGFTADVNSLYPSMMSGESGNYYPIGLPTFWKGNFIPDDLEDKFYFVRFKTRFYIKENKLPFIQVKNTFRYRVTEMLKTSDVFYNGEYHKFLIDENGEKVPTTVTLTMTQTDYKLFLEHYNVEDFEILDGCYFDTTIGIFDKYIDKYKQIKINSKGAEREQAKLFLNNLYGKLASSTVSNFKIAYLKDDGVVGFYTVIASDKKAGYIPCGSAITSYARNFTIRAAQANFYGVNKRGFIYADTDSIHCDIPITDVKAIQTHPTDFCKWKIETEWESGWFVRQKTYIEKAIKEDGEPIEPTYILKCAGMPQRCKDLFIANITNTEISLKTEEEEDFMRHKYKLEDFDIGLKVPSKLRATTVRGGTLLVDSTYQMR